MEFTDDQMAFCWPNSSAMPTHFIETVGISAGFHVVWKPSFKKGIEKLCNVSLWQWEGQV